MLLFDVEPDTLVDFVLSVDEIRAAYKRQTFPNTFSPRGILWLSESVTVPIPKNEEATLNL